MRRTMIAISLFPLLLCAAAPASAATNEQKMETCKFGADDAKLAGKKHADFVKKCLSNANYEPAARRDAMKKTAKPAKPAVAPAAPKQ